MNASMSAGFRTSTHKLRGRFEEADDFGGRLDRLRVHNMERSARIELIRAQILQGTYDTSERLDAAIDCMLARIALAR